MTPKQLYANYRALATTDRANAHYHRLAYLIARFSDQPEVLKLMLEKAYPLAGPRKLNHGHQPGVLSHLARLRGAVYLADKKPQPIDPSDADYRARWKREQAEAIERSKVLVEKFFDTLENAQAAIKNPPLPVKRD